MSTRDKILLTCALALSGFGISLIGTSTTARQSPITLLFTSVTLYLSEAVLFWMFFVGLWLVIRTFLQRPLARLTASSQHDLGPRGTELVTTALQRFCFFQIALVAVWSICFKGALYTTLDPALSHHLLAKSQSLGIAIPAELIILLLILIGLAKYWVTGKSTATATRTQNT